MRRNESRTAALWVGALLSALLLAPAARGARDGEELIFLLRYVAADYGDAVRSGQVIDEAEYREVLGFASVLAEETAGRVDGELVTELGRLRALIVGRAAWGEIRELVRDLAPRLESALRVDPVPSQRPDLARGAALFATDCAACHGPRGAGDGFAAATQDPPPMSLRGERLQLLSPHQVFGALRFGVAGTAMPSFASARTPGELWDVAFFVMTLREDFAPLPADPPLRLSLAELSARSNDELLARLRGRNLPVTLGALDHARAKPPEPAEPKATTELADVPGQEVALALERAFARVAERVTPGVVGLTIYTPDPEWTPERVGAGRDAAWHEAHRDELRYPGHRPAGQGSGFLVDPAGHLLTCHGTIVDPATGEPAELIDVELNDHAHFRARLIGAEPTVDLAVLKVEAPFALPSVPLGTSETVAVGQWAIALADPPGVARTFEVGTIAARAERQCYQQQRASTLLQTSVRLGRASFCGPLANVRGDVVGITVPEGAADDLPAHALPIDLALTLFEALKVAESRRSPWIGVSVLELGWRLRRQLGDTPLTGVYIDGVADPSPASRAGIRVGDILVAIDGEPVLAVADFQRALYLGGIGKTLRLDLSRAGTPLSLTLPIEQRP